MEILGDFGHFNKEISGIGCLGKLKALKRIFMFDCGMKGQEIEILAQISLSLLEYLDLSRNQIGGSLDLKHFPSLKSLCLSECGLTEKDILVIKNSSLSQLNLLELSSYDFIETIIKLEMKGSSIWPQSTLSIGFT